MDRVSGGGSDPHVAESAGTRRLLQAGQSLVARLELDGVLDEVLETARDLTGARYAALGVLDEQRRQLERFITKGVDPVTHRAIGDLPRGRGILGVLIDEPRPLRLDRVGDDPRSYGFPAGHPPMDTFLGVPILIRGEAWGNLYLTEKQGGKAFSDADEEAIVVLAGWAAIAIDNARLFEASERRRVALERAVLGLEATTAIARAIGAETQLDRVLELIVKRGRALVEARALVIALPDSEQLVLAAGAGELLPDDELPRHLPRDLLHSVMRRREPLNLPDVRRRELADVSRLGVAEPRSALLVPLVFQGRSMGVLCAFDHRGGQSSFAEEHERMLLSFAASAATAVATAKNVAEERLRDSTRSAERERARWARELHDDTLQGMAALRVALSSALRRGDPERLADTVRGVVDDLGTEIDGLRSLITDLRPAALDELGPGAAMSALVARVRSSSGLEIVTHFDLAHESGRASSRLEPDVEIVVYRVLQEALTNAVKHSGASTVSASVREDDGQLLVEVRDDGRGFDPEAAGSGFGLIGMRERVALLDGSLSVRSAAGETTVTARLPARHRESSQRS